SALILPVRSRQPSAELPTPVFGEPEGTPPLSTEQLIPGEQRWVVSRDLADYSSALEVVKDLGVVRFEEIDLDVGRRAYERYSWVDDDFQSVRGNIEWTMRFTRGDWTVRTVSRTTLTSTPTDFHLHAELDAYEGEERVYSRNWSRVIPRDHV